MTILINPWGEYAVNDDWDFFLHVRQFLQDDFYKNSLIDSAFISQGFIALVWSKIFGFSFSALHSLTILFTVVFVLGVYKILSHFSVSNQAKTITLLSLLFNPIIFHSSYSFMTEVYCLTFMVWSVYSFLVFLENSKYSHLALASIFALLSTLVRQFGVVLFVAFIIVLVVKNLKSLFKKSFLFQISLVLFSLVASTLILKFWPQYQGDNSERMANLFLPLSQIQTVFARLLAVLPYVAFFFSPLILGSLATKSKKVLAAILLSAFVAAYPIFNSDVFSIGNVFHLEGILVRDEITLDFTLFNNPMFKIFLSYYLAVNLIVLLVGLFKRPKIDFSLQKLLFLLLVLGLTVPVLIVGDFFDRYLINAYVFGFLMMVIWHAKINKFSFFATFLLVFIGVLLTWDFVVSSRLKWDQAKQLSARTGLVKSIYVSSPYQKYAYVSQFTDSSQMNNRYFANSQYECFVQTYAIPQEPRIEKLLMLNFNGLQVENPRIPEYKDKPYIKIENNLKRLIYNTEYFSPVKALTGSRSFVGTYCVKTFKKFKDLPAN